MDLNSFGIAPNAFMGIKVRVVNDAPTYKKVYRYKAHRKKKRGQMVKVFDKWVCLVKDGEVIHDRKRDIYHMNRRTLAALEQAQL